MTRRTGGGPACRNRIVAALAAVALAAAMLLPAAPAEAGWLGRGLGVAGAARSFKKNFGEVVDLVGDTLGAAIQGDFEEVERLSGELREVPGRIITDAFPVLSIGAAALKGADAAGKRLKAAGRRVGRFVGDRVADARMALEAGEYETEAGVLDRNRPLPAVTVSGPSGTSRPAPSGSSAANAPDPWGQAPEEDEETAAGGADPWGQDPKEEETAAGEVDPPGQDGGEGRQGGDLATKRLQGEYAAALDRFLSAEKGGSDYEAALSALLEREKELLAKVVGPEEQELTPDERRRVQACLAEREFNPGTPDGIFGPRTRNAIRAWQASQGREESGRLDQSSARTLLEECEVAVAEAETDTVTTTESVERTFEPKCADIRGGKRARDKVEMCYVEFVDRPGCYLALNTKGVPEDMITDSYDPIGIFFNLIDPWNRGEFSGERITLRWSGGCSDSVPDGQGTVSAVLPRIFTEEQNSDPNIDDWKWSKEWTGQFVDGVPQGNWTSSFRVSSRITLKNTKRRQRVAHEYQSEARFSMMNGEVHGEYTDISRLKDVRSYRDPATYSTCGKIMGKFENGKFHHGGSSSC